MAFDPQANAEYPNLVNVAKRLDPDGNIADIAELLNQTNEILDDAVWIEGNLPTGHRDTTRSDVPAGVWRKLNYGVKPHKSGTTQVTDSIGLLEDRSAVDVEIANLNGNSAAWRMSEDRAFIEGLSQSMATALFYADTTVDPEKPLGFAPRYDAIGDPTDKPTANSYMNHVLDLGGIGGTSIWLIGWAEDKVRLIYPKGSKAGLEMKDLGEVDAFDSDGGKFRAYESLYKVKFGLSIKDWRYVVRLANVDPAMTLDTAGIDTITDRLIEATAAIPNLKGARMVFYMHRKVMALLHKAAVRKANMSLSFGDIYGIRNQLNISGIPIKQCDAILLNEGHIQ